MDLFSLGPKRKLKKYAKKHVSDNMTMKGIEKGINSGEITTLEEIDEHIEKGRQFVESTFAVQKWNGKTVIKPMFIDGEKKFQYLYFKFEGSDLYLVECDDKKYKKVDTPLKFKNV